MKRYLTTGLLAAFVAIVVLLIFGVYTSTPAGYGAAVAVTNRFTGSVWICGAGVCYPQVEKGPG